MSDSPVATQPVLLRAEESAPAVGTDLSLTFSIVVATLNPGPKLEATLRSVLEQGSDWELLVFDGGSKDGSVETLRALAATEPRLQWWSEPDKGVWDGFNKGIAKAKGRYLYFLPAGDRLRPDVLARVERELPSHNRGFVYGLVFLEEYGVARDCEMSTLALACRNIPHQAIFYGRDIFALFGFYQTKYPILADHPINIRCFADSRVEVKYLDLIMADFEGFGLSSQRRDRNLQRELPRIVRRYLGPRIAAQHALYHYMYRPATLFLRGVKRAVLRCLGVDPDRGRRPYAERVNAGKGQG